MIYLICFERHLSHARHYIGYCDPTRFESRQAEHRAGRGARLLAACVKRGITFRVVRVWAEGDRAMERRLKRRKEGPRLCPECSARTGKAVRGQLS